MKKVRIGFMTPLEFNKFFKIMGKEWQMDIKEKICPLVFTFVREKDVQRLKVLAEKLNGYFEILD